MKKIIVLLDMDCFFAQVEQKRLNLPDVPLCVQQHQDIICVNYLARQLGVKKHSHPDFIKKAFPQAKVFLHINRDLSI